MRLRRVMVMFTLVCAILATAGIVSAATIATEFTPGTGTVGTNLNTVGWRFGLTEDISVTTLGSLNGLAGRTHGVGIYSEATQTLLASTTVTNSGTGQWVWADLATPVTLTAGNVYRIASNPNGDNWVYNVGGFSVGSEILVGNALSPSDPGNIIAAYEEGNLLQYPAQTPFPLSLLQNGIYGPNFQYELAGPPPPTTTLFFDDFEAGAHVTTIGTVAPVVGSWNINGGGTGGAFYWKQPTTNGTLPASAYGQLYGMTIRGADDITYSRFTNIDAQFAEQSDAADLVTFETDFFGQIAGSTPVDLELSILSGLTELNTVTLRGGSSSGSVLVNGVATSMTYGINQWHHLTMEYNPTSSTFDLTIGGQTLTGLSMATPSAVDGFRFTETSTGQDRWVMFDNVEVTLTEVPEPSCLALLACGLMGLVACVRRRR